MSRIRVTHGLFKGIVGKYRDGLKNSEEWITMGCKCVLRNYPQKIITLPSDFYVLLTKTAMKWKKPLIEFTHGYDEKNGAHCITLVHPEDHFVRRVGYEIVTGKLKKHRSDPYPEDHKKIYMGE